MRIWSVPSASADQVSASVVRVLAAEAAAGLDTVQGHDGFAAQVATVRNDFLEFLVGCQRAGKRVAGYGAPGKGNTLLNHCGVRADLMEFTVVESAQARAVPSRHSHSDIPWNDWPRSLIMSSSCRGISAPRLPPNYYVSDWEEARRLSPEIRSVLTHFFEELR